MFPLFETVCLLEGKIQHRAYHEARYRKSYSQVFGKLPPHPLLVGLHIPEAYTQGKVKMRIDYNEKERECRFSSYTSISLTDLKLVHSSTIAYSLKHVDRSELISLWNQRGTCQDVLIVKDGWITDSSYTNIILFDGGEWWTPDTPLLVGTCRERLIQEKKITAAPIHVDELDQFTHFQLINAMRDFDPEGGAPIEGIQ